MDKNDPLNRFVGEMSAMYFIKLTEQEVESFHYLLKTIYKQIDISNLPSSEKLQATLYKDNTSACLDNIFFYITPKYVSNNSSAIKVTEFNRSTGIEEIGSKIIVYHTYTLRECFENIDGIDCLLIFLNKIIENKEIISYLNKILDIIIDVASYNPIQLNLFFNKGGIPILVHVLEKIAAKCSLTLEIMGRLKELQSFAKQPYSELYTKLVLLNGSLWATASELVKEHILDYISVTSNTKLIDCYFNLIFSFFNRSVNSSFQSICERTLVHVTQLITDKSIFKTVYLGLLNRVSNMAYMKNPSAEILCILNSFSNIRIYCKR